MKAIEFKLGNGKGVERIAEVVSALKVYRSADIAFMNNKLHHGRNKINCSIMYDADVVIGKTLSIFIKSIQEGVIDDGDIFDYMNESGDDTFMDTVYSTIKRSAMSRHVNKYM